MKLHFRLNVASVGYCKMVSRVQGRLIRDVTEICVRVELATLAREESQEFQHGCLISETKAPGPH